MKKIGIMQPYFMPYIGYFQLINAVDEFIIYDNIQYTKKGWINRNRILQNGGGAWKHITLPLKSDSDFLDVKERYLADSYERGKMFRQIETTYHKAPYYEDVRAFLKDIIFYPDDNLFMYIYHSLLLVCDYVGITTPILVSSTLNYDNRKTGQDKVLAICIEREAEEYINTIGGMDLYKKDSFAQKGILLKFIETEFEEYRQFGQTFIQGLSILDIMMFNSKEDIQRMIKKYRLLEGRN